MIARCIFSYTLLHVSVLRSAHFCEMTLLLTQVANFSFRRAYLSVVVRKAAEETVFANFQSLLHFDCEHPMPHLTPTKLGLPLVTRFQVFLS